MHVHAYMEPSGHSNVSTPRNTPNAKGGLT